VPSEPHAASNQPTADQQEQQQLQLMRERLRAVEAKIEALEGRLTGDKGGKTGLGLWPRVALCAAVPVTLTASWVWFEEARWNSLPSVLLCEEGPLSVCCGMAGATALLCLLFV